MINIYGDIEILLARTDEIKQPKRRETLIENAENARISLRLVTLDANVPFKETPDEFAVHEPEPQELIAFLKAMEFGSITRRDAGSYSVNRQGPVPASARANPSCPALATAAGSTTDQQ